MTQNRSQKSHTFVPKGDTKMVSKVTQFHSEEVKKNATKTTEISPGDEGEKCSRIVTHIPVSNGVDYNFIEQFSSNVAAFISNEILNRYTVPEKSVYEGGVKRGKAMEER